MKVKVYSVLDEKACAFAPPFFIANDGLAMRAFGDFVNDPKSTIYNHAEDFALYKLGEFDDISGVISGLNKPEFFVRASDFMKPKEV